jgi:alkylhydroperoxidase/carboxymuconolactone decarboxylase family protein YurZ
MSEVTDEAWLSRGYEMVDAVYGAGAGKIMAAAKKGAFMEETVGHLFGEIWSRPHLSVRDRRLLVLGATAALGRKDLVEIQIRGALAKGELSDAALEEAALQLAFYVGWGNASATWAGIVAAQKAHAAGHPQTMGTTEHG